MNKREREMLDILFSLKDSGSVAVKAEFEAEGTRVEELLRLLEIARKSGLGIGLKVGGCEAVRDLIEAKQFGVDYVIAPMVESAYALSKYIAAKNRVYSVEEREEIKFLFNVETLHTYENLDEIIAVASENEGADGVVFGRVDFVGSMDLGRDDVNSAEVNNYVIDVARRAKNSNLEMVVGGGVSMDAIPALKEIAKVHLTRFETRKVIFSSEALSQSNFAETLLKCVHFELLWLINKSEYYGFIQAEDQKRIEMLSARWKVLNV